MDKGSYPPQIAALANDMIRSVQNEFGEKSELFTPILLRMDLLHGPEFEAMKWPGVYVFIHGVHGCVKVGKSHSNASKRALQHCGTDNTTSKDGTIQMAQLSQNQTYMLVFALQRRDSVHWVLALEHYLENSFHPKIKSVRNG